MRIADIVHRLRGHLPIYLMTSFSRSGETLLLRSLNEHPDIIVLHQLTFRDHPQDFQLFQTVTEHPGTSIRPPDEFLYRKGAGKIMVVKHAVWNHQYPFNGFILARNPFACIASMLRHTESETETRRRGRLARWARKMDQNLVKIAEEGDEVEALSLLYLSKMQAAAMSKHRTVRYEDFVRAPEKELRKIVSHLGVRWDVRTLTSERSYAAGDIGHGGINLAEPIRRDVPIYAGGLTRSQFDTVLRTTAPVLPHFGYRVKDGVVEVASPLA